MDEDAKKSLSERFFKERRLFLAVSVVLLAHQILGITAVSDVESLGLKFTIAKPGLLFDAVWAVWWWGIVCYVQQLYSLQPFKFFPTERRVTVREALNSRFVAYHVRRRVRASFKRQVLRAHRESYTVAAPVFVPAREEVRGSTMASLPAIFAINVQLRWNTIPNDPRCRISLLGTG